MITGARAFVFYSENPLKGCLAAGDLTNSVVYTLILLHGFDLGLVRF
jgi:hypothetical protein